LHSKSFFSQIAPDNVKHQERNTPDGKKETIQTQFSCIHSVTTTELVSFIFELYIVVTMEATRQCRGKKIRLENILLLEIKPCRLGARIQDVEAFWYKTEIKIIYFLPL